MRPLSGVVTIQIVEAVFGELKLEGAQASQTELVIKLADEPRAVGEASLDNTEGSDYVRIGDEDGDGNDEDTLSSLDSHVVR